MNCEANNGVNYEKFIFDHYSQKLQITKRNRIFASGAIRYGTGTDRLRKSML